MIMLCVCVCVCVCVRVCACVCVWPQDRKVTLTLEDLTPALCEFGITIKKPSYYT